MLQRILAHGFRRVTITITVCLGLLIAGCEKRDPDALAARTVAATELTDAEAVETLARQVFMNPEAVSAVTLESGEIALTVTVHPSTDAKVTTLRQGPNAAAVDVGYVLGMTVIGGRRMVKYGRQRKLAQLTIKVKHTLLDESDKRVDIDIFGYTLRKDSFEQYLNTGSAIDIAKGKALATIEKTCVIDYNNFDQVRYAPKDKRGHGAQNPSIHN
jgi:hypothetical protein